MKTIQDQFRALRRAGVPIAAIETADPGACVKQCKDALNGRKDTTPLLLWDIVRGFVGLNALGEAWVAKIPDDIKTSMGNPVEALRYAHDKAPGDTICFYANAQRFIDDAGVLQAVWNIRDTWKAKHALLVLLSPGLTLPVELKHDVVIISEPLPDAAELREIADRICEDADLPPEKRGDLDKAARTLRGLSAFAAEQSVALCVSPAGIDADDLDQRKRRTIEQTPGLSVWTGGETFDDLGGLSNLKTFLTRVLTSGQTPVQAVLYLDEIDKSLSGATGDTSGTSQDQLGVLLKLMQDQNLPGMLLIGHAGCGKSAIAKASGNLNGAPVVACDLGAMKGSLVGQSEARIREAMRIFNSVADNQGIVIATCNRIGNLPPELRRRFTLGTFFVDLPDHAERTIIWKLWMSRYELAASQELPECDSWTGAEVRACCDVAFRTGLSLQEAASYIVPVIKAAPDQVEQLRKLANGRFISASYPGAYVWPPKEPVQKVSRKLALT